MKAIIELKKKKLTLTQALILRSYCR